MFPVNPSGPNTVGHECTHTYCRLLLHSGGPLKKDRNEWLYVDANLIMKDEKRRSHSFDRVAVQKLLSLHRKGEKSRQELCQIDALHSLSVIDI